MLKYFVGIDFICPSCRKKSQAALNVPDPYTGDGAGLDGLDLTLSDDVACEHCNESFELNVFLNGASCQVEFQDFTNNIIVSSDVYPESDDEFLDISPPQDPMKILLQEGGEAIGLLRHPISQFGEATIKRMIFAQIISAMEVYLQDKIKISVNSSYIVRFNIISRNDKLNSEKFPLRYLSSKDFIDNQIMKYLNGIIFHNIPVVENVLKSLSHEDFNPPARIKERLSKAVSVRHDCVHRGGYDRLGNKVTVSDAYIKDVWGDVRSYCSYVDSYIDRVTDEIIPF
ncbi:hypothetical protein [Roseibium polysiphoniae]|uniref:RiboL-PSP-HEPN domain-containing protein n=1 Tax=Roseibium polysiphoniae TaxID=2571221 RepID=A0ABR9C685_9HYPH|nr:hypothetical protein [Roseibium polysiphoniae]MBD8875444.1 hypothetical protein [Roseibium polysiphoniae]